jgi:hypothetical protein
MQWKESGGMETRKDRIKKKIVLLVNWRQIALNKDRDQNWKNNF